MRPPSFLPPLLVAAVLLTSGCAAASAVGAALGAAFSGLAYFADGNVERTFVVSLSEVWQASLTVLRLMDLTIAEGTRDEHTGELTGTNPALTVTLTMTSVTARATRVTIGAVEGTYGRDRATASEVLNQLALRLPHPPAAGHPGAHPLVPPPQDPRAIPGEGPADLEQPEGEADLARREAGEVHGLPGEAGLPDGGLPRAGEGGSGVAEDRSPPRSHLENLGEKAPPGGYPPVPPEEPPPEGRGDQASTPSG